MSHHKSREVVLAVDITADVAERLDTLREAWKLDAHSMPKGLAGSESKEGEFVLVAAEAAFTTLPGACVVKGIGAIEMIGTQPVFEEGASSKTLVLRRTFSGWQFSVKFVPPIIRDRNRK